MKYAFLLPLISGPAMRKLISILNPVYWTTAQEVGEAVNGYTLTGGIFRRETQVEFATGKDQQALVVCSLYKYTW